MGNNLFYKALAAISTVGIIALAGNSFVRTGSDKANELDELIAKTKREVIEFRKDALVEVNSARKDALSEVNTAKRTALSEVTGVRKDVVKALEKAKTGKTSESVWLILRMGWTSDWALEKIEMKDMDQCEMQGVEWMASTRIKDDVDYLGYTCLEGN